MNDHHRDDHTTRAIARLPRLEIEILHRRLPDGDAEQISVSLQAMPSFEAFGRFVETVNPFALWVQATQVAWTSWLEAARTVMLPWSGASVPPRLRGDTDRDHRQTSDE